MSIGAVTNSVINKSPSLQQSKTVNLSLDARNYLAYLESRFTDVNFYVGGVRQSSGIRDFDSDAVYNCFICPDLLEEMAVNRDVAEKIERVIMEMRAQIDDVHYGLKEKGLEKHVINYAVEINEDGSVDYVLMLNDSIKGLHDKDDEESTNVLKAKSAKELLELLDGRIANMAAKTAKNYDIVDFS